MAPPNAVLVFCTAIFMQFFYQLLRRQRRCLEYVEDWMRIRRARRERVHALRIIMLQQASRLRQRRLRRRVTVLMARYLRNERIRIGPIQRDIWIRMRPQLWWDNFQTCVDDRQWRQHFRISRNTFLYIVECVRPLMEKRVTNFRQPICIEKRVAVGLWRLATGSDYRTIQELFGVGRSTACTIFLEFVTVVVIDLRPRFLHRPTPAKFLDIVRGFRDVWGFTQCAGAIDGTHIPIIAPVNHRNSYYNRKGWYSVVCQAVCDHRYRFWDVYVGWPGRTHDARVFSNSPLFQDGQDGRLFPNQRERFGNVDVPVCLIGDPAYPLLSWLMKAYPENGRTPENQQHFNYRLSRARMVIECAFGRLKGRWRILLKRNDNDLSLVPTIVMACCTLHNICETRQEVFDENAHQVPPERMFRVNAADVGDQRQARNQRDSVCAYLSANRLA